MKKMKQKQFSFLTILLFFSSLLFGCELLAPVESGTAISEASQEMTQQTTQGVAEGEAYSTKEEVAEYLYLYGELPPNYLTKGEAEELGWDSREGNLWEVADGMSIGGDYFGNREGLLPDEPGRDYYEADINYQGGYRNAERIVFSNDGLIFYTDDHYESFEQLYGEGAE